MKHEIQQFLNGKVIFEKSCVSQWLKTNVVGRSEMQIRLALLLQAATEISEE